MVQHIHFKLKKRKKKEKAPQAVMSTKIGKIT